MWPEDAFSLPARDGYDVGGAQERAMSDRVGGHGGIRETYEANPDGSVTTLRTRLGWPAFETTGGVNSGAICLQSPLAEWAFGPGQPVDMFTLREWHSERDALVSSDGLITIVRRPLRVWSAKLKNGALVESHFSTPSGPTEIRTPTPRSHQFIEGEWATRTWYAPQEGVGGLLRMFFSVRRVAEIHLSYREVPFTWLFSSDAGAVVTKPEPACINQSGSEGGLATRIMYSNAQIKQAGVVINARLGLLRFADPGGFLGALEAPPVVGQTPVDLRSTFNTCLSDLSDALALGQAWHGWAYTTGIETAYGIKYPAGYSIGVDALADTSYVSVPNLPSPSENLPEGFVESGKMLYKDAILFGENKRYSPLASLAIGPNRWVHHSVTHGVSILRVAPVGVVGQDDVALQIWRDGTWTVDGLIGSPAMIGEVVIRSSVIPEEVDSCPEKAWFVSGQTGIAEIARYVGPYELPPQHPNTVSLNQSPAGKRAALCHYVMGKVPDITSTQWTSLFIASAWELSVSDEYVCAAEEKWQRTDTSGMTGYTMVYWEYYSRDRIKRYHPDPSYVLYGHPIYDVTYTVGIRGPYFRGAPHPDTEHLLMAVYNGSEDLKLIKLISEYPMDFGKYANIDVAEPYAEKPYSDEPLPEEWSSESARPLPGYPWADVVNEEAPMPFGTPFKQWIFPHSSRNPESPYYSATSIFSNPDYLNGFYQHPTRYRITIGDVSDGDYVFTDSFVDTAAEPRRKHPAMLVLHLVICSNNVNLIYFQRDEDSIPERVLFVTPDAVEDVTDKFIDGTITFVFNSSNVAAAFNPRTKQLRWQTNGEIFTAI